MARPGASRSTRAVPLALLGAGLLMVIGAGWRMRSDRTSAAHSGHAAPIAPSTGRVASAGTHAGAGDARPASITVAVTDEHGPLGGAVVRLTPRDGEIALATTGSDGIARAQRLAPGIWRISASADGHAPAALPVRQLAPGGADRVELRLSSGGRTLRGTVSDTSGGAVAGARVEAAALGPSGLPDDAVSTTVTADDGGYHLTVAEGSLWAAVTSDDYAPQGRRVDVGPAGAVANFALVPGGAIEGAVIDERTREPVPGASVRGRRAAGVWQAAERRTVAGADGRFRLTGLKPGDWQVDAAAPPRASRDATHVGLAVGEQVSRVELTIGTGPALRGRVVDETGAPAPGVAVHAVGRTTARVTADAAGDFAFEGLRSGSYVLSAASPAYLHAEVTSAWLTDRDIDGVVVHARRGIAIRGHVEPRQACRIEHAFEVAIGRDTRAVPDVATGPDGEFALGPFDAGPATLVARCASGDQGELRAAVAAGMPDAVLAVSPGASLAGRVVGTDGAPLPGVRVVASAPEALAALEAGGAGARFRTSHGVITSGDQALTDAAGAFRIAGLPAGAYGFQVVDRGAPLPPRGALPRVELAAREHRSGIELAVERPGGAIAGTVTGPDGAPLADAWVSAYPQESLLDGMNADGLSDASPVASLAPGGNDPAPPPVLTDAQGHYRLTGLFRIPYTVIAEGQRGRLRARPSRVVPDATVDLQVQGVSTLSGTATGPAGPARVFTVTLQGPTQAVRSVTNGAFAFDGIAPGNYALYAESLAGGGVGHATVAPGAAVSVDIALAANGTVIGAVVDATGQPAAGVRVVLRDDNTAELVRPPAVTAADGSFRLEHAPGTYYLVVLHPPARPLVKPGVAIESGRLVDLGRVAIDAAPPSAR